MKIYLFFLFVLFNLSLLAQDAQNTSTSYIEIDASNSSYQFNAKLPDLVPIPGGRTPFYTYLWDFGDGHFSTDESPNHSYTKEGEHEVTLYATSNYDFGTRPPRPVKKLSVMHGASESNSSVAEQNFFSSNGVFQLAKNANALPGEDMVIISGVKPIAGRGKIFLLTNEKIFKNPGFIYKGQSKYNNEQIIPIDDLLLDNMWASVQEVKITQSGSPDYGIEESKSFKVNESVKFFSDLYNSYQTVTAYELDVKDSSAQFSLINMDISHEMLKDTNAIVTVTGIYVPDNSTQVYVHQLDIPIVASHDPNKMSLKQSRLNYRKLKGKKKITYKVQFQNDGEGDAQQIRLEMNLPEQLNPESFELLNLYPNCPPCNEHTRKGCWRYEVKGKDSVFFYFEGISLPGSKAENVSDKDSTKGFIRFNVKSHGFFPNKPFKGRTAIFFDKNEPVITNFATGKFRKSLSPILFAGYNFLLNEGKTDQALTSLENSLNYQFGIGLSPLAPYKKLYWQLEIYVNTWEQSKSIEGILANGAIKIGDNYYEYSKYDHLFHAKYMQLRFIPLQLRYNLNRFVSFGTGVMAKMDINLSYKEERVYYVLTAGRIPEKSPPFLVSDQKLTDKNFGLQPFLDVNVGLVYLGPSLGLRYNYGINQFSYLNLYFAWRL